MRPVLLFVLGIVSACGGTSSAESASGVEPTPRTTPLAEFLPKPTGECPVLADGYVTFAPAGIPPRRVRLWLDASVTASGPLVFYWHGTGSKPEEAPYGLGNPTIASIKAQGGIVAAPEHDPDAAQFPWYLTTGAGKEDDLVLADEVLACVREARSIDERRIHVAGMSAGALQTVQMAYRRSGYVASIVPYSGGLVGYPNDQDPENRFAAMILHGGPKDQVIVNFEKLSVALHDGLETEGRFSFLCNHGLGHKIPFDARPAVWQFLQAHPFGASPSPYEDGLPSDFPSYCALDDAASAMSP